MGATAFARSIGLDRSALSQFLAEGSTRLPRAETLARIAETHGVSLDWLLGLSQSEDVVGEIAEALEIERSAPSGGGESPIARWHAEAVGYKIRYVPQSIPDLLLTEEVTRHVFGGPRVRAETKIEAATSQLAYTRRPETDMEVCMPRQTFEALAAGAWAWSRLDAGVRRAQIAHARMLVEELYPTFRLFLYDGRSAFSAPYTVFGPLRAALYVGGLYVVVNSVEHIRALSRHFDELIRKAEIPPDRAGAFLAGLEARDGGRRGAGRDEGGRKDAGSAGERRLPG